METKTIYMISHLTPRRNNLTKFLEACKIVGEISCVIAQRKVESYEDIKAVVDEFATKETQELYRLHIAHFDIKIEG